MAQARKTPGRDNDNFTQDRIVRSTELENCQNQPKPLILRRWSETHRISAECSADERRDSPHPTEGALKYISPTSAYRYTINMTKYRINLRVYVVDENC